MKYVKTLALCIMLVIVLFSCKKKEYPESSAGNPEFYFKGDVNGSQVNIDAGINGYYMYASYQQDSSSHVYGFIGTLNQTTCSNCPNSIQVQVNGNSVAAPGGSSLVDSALYVSYYPYLKGTPSSVSYNVQFNSSFNQVMGSYSWDFGDGTTSNQLNPSHLYSRIGKQNVCFTANNPTCSSSLCNPLKIGIPGDTCRTQISITHLGVGDSVSFSPSTYGTAPFSYLWNFGDGNTSVLQAPTHIYSQSGQYQVSLRVIDANSDTALAHYNTNTLNDTACAANYSISTINQVPNPSAFSNIIVNWTDAAGHIYTSNSALQPSSSYFQIVSVENYKNNEHNQPTKKIHIRFKCNVYYGASMLSINNGEAVIAVAYK